MTMRKKSMMAKELSFVEGKAQPVFSEAEMISERVFVELDCETDGGGRKDRLAVYIKRPLSSDKLPVIYTANPYAFGCNEEVYNAPHSITRALSTALEGSSLQPYRKITAPTPPEGDWQEVDCQYPFPELEAMGELPDYFLPRGFAKVVAGGIGTKGSTGIRTCGSVEETLSTIGVIEWLAGNRHAYSSLTGDQKVSASWCNGKVAMTGKSYLGTLAIAAAVTGVEGLQTIIPEAAISNWYDYYRENGVLSSALGWQGDDADKLTEYCFSRRFDSELDQGVAALFADFLEKMRHEQDRETGNYNQFWHERNYLNDVSHLTASVFLIHGLNDWNVKPKQFASFWEKIQGRVKSKLLLHQGAHSYINRLASLDFYHHLNLWLSEELLGQRQLKTPKVMVQSNLDQNQWQPSENWPLARTLTDYCFSELAVTTGSSAFVDNSVYSGVKESQLTDEEWQTSFVKAPRSDQLRLLVTGLESVRLSGTTELILELALDQPTAIISGMLVDYGPANRYTQELGMSPLDSDKQHFIKEEKASTYKIITRGHLNAQNRLGNQQKVAVVRGQFYTYRLMLHPTDYTLLAGHQLGVIIYGIDRETTQRPQQVTHYSLNLEKSRVRLPLEY